MFMEKFTLKHYNKSFFTPCSFTYEKRAEKVLADFGSEYLINALSTMLKIRQLETRLELAYREGFIGGFFHSDIGQEAIVTSPVFACGADNWFFQSYRCHGLALALGLSLEEIAYELYGKASGIAKGRGGSMHLCTSTMPGGFGIVGGHVPLATGAAFSLKYQQQKDLISLCFLGEGALAQGVVYESINLASLHSLPLLIIIENNGWGMGTNVNNALIFSDNIAKKLSSAFSLEGYTINGMNFIDCLLNFKYFHNSIIENPRPIIVEAICSRFKGHSISDPGLYRCKKELEYSLQLDPICQLKETLINLKIIDEDFYKEIENKIKVSVIEALKYAESAPWPSRTNLEEDVYAN